MQRTKGIILALVLCSLTGCVWVENTDDLAKYIEDIRNRAARPIKPLPEFFAYEAFVYEGTLLRNPFLPVVQSLPDENGLNTKKDLGNTPAPNLERSKDYLESFDIEDLSMVGNIAKKGERSWALIVDPKGEIHRVSVGDHIGADYGKVVAVSENRVQITETISNGRGGWITRPRSIQLIEFENP